jgi:hypothetical protein
MVVFAFAWSAWTQDVIYVTPSQPIYYGSAPTTQNIDITGSGCTNFILVCDGAGGSFLYPKASNTMVVVPLPPPDISSVVAALNPGDVVGPNASSINPAYQWWDATNDSTGSSTLADQIESDSQLYVVDNFAGQTAYIGFDIVRNGENYYGWMEVENPFEIAAGSIVGWAYATTPNTPIVAGAGLLVPLAPVEIVRPGNLRLRWQSQIGQAYLVQFKTQVDAPSWINGDLAIIATATNTSADIPMTGPAGYYRVIQVP